MSEYIEREAAFKLIKEQKEKETGAFSKGFNKGLRIAMSIINNKEILPAANVVEVGGNRQFDRIRNMTVEELAEFLHKHLNCHICVLKNKCTFRECEQGIKQWLESEVTE